MDTAIAHRLTDFTIATLRVICAHASSSGLVYLRAALARQNKAARRHQCIAHRGSLDWQVSIPQIRQQNREYRPPCAVNTYYV